MQEVVNVHYEITVETAVNSSWKAFAGPIKGNVGLTYMQRLLPSSPTISSIGRLKLSFCYNLCTFHTSLIIPCESQTDCSLDIAFDLILLFYISTSFLKSLKLFTGLWNKMRIPRRYSIYHAYSGNFKELCYHH